MSPLAPAAVAQEVAAHAGGRPALVAVSGGVDSMVLWDLVRRHGVPHAVAHVDYGLRGSASTGDRELVTQLAAERGIRLHIGRPEGLPPGAANLQHRAREWRRGFLEELLAEGRYGLVALGHHADDQLESVLAGLVRGGGPRALAAMRPWRPPYLRPLLGYSRAQILGYAEEHDVAYREDESNLGDAYLRNRLRHHVIPALLRSRPGARTAALHSATDLAEALDFAEGQARSLLRSAESDRLPHRYVKAQLAGVPGLGFLLHAALLPLGAGRTQISGAVALLETADAANSPNRRAAPVGSHFAAVVDAEYFWVEDTREVEPFERSVAITEGCDEVLESLAGRLRVQVLPTDCGERPGPQGEHAFVVPCRAGQRITWRTALRGDRLGNGPGRHTRVRSVLAQARRAPISRGRASVVLLDERVAWVSGLRTEARRAAGDGGAELLCRLSYEADPRFAGVVPLVDR